jgi:hypothetical protein
MNSNKEQEDLVNNMTRCLNLRHQKKKCSVKGAKKVSQTNSRFKLKTNQLEGLTRSHFWRSSTDIATFECLSLFLDALHF